MVLDCLFKPQIYVVPYVVTNIEPQQKSLKLYKFYCSDDCNHSKPQFNDQIFQAKKKISKYDNMCTNSELVKMVKLVSRNLTKFCQILENFTFLESFDGGQYDYNVCNHLSVKIHATLVNFLVLDFRPLHTALHKI